MRAAAIGVAIVGAHAAGFVALAAHVRGTELAVELSAPPAAPALAIAGRVPAAIADRVAIADDGSGPGLHRRSWTVHYRGGLERSVGAAQLVGPFQDPAHPPCSGRITLGQRLLDDGHAGPGTIAAEMRREIDAELTGESIFPIGDYLRIDHLALQWARLEAHPGDAKLVGAAPHGYVRATATIVFDRVEVPLVVALIPDSTAQALTFRIAASAELAFGNRFVQWVSNRLGGDRLASRLARRQIDQVLVTALAPPPPFELEGGQQLRFTYCDEPPEIADASWAALPFAVAIGRFDRDPSILPPRLGRGPRTTPSTTTLAIDLDLDALNALLFELWRGGFLDRRLAEAGLDRSFNADPTVVELLSLRVSPLRLALPPVVSATAESLHLAAEARLILTDGAATSSARLWGALALRFEPAAHEQVAVDLGALALSCERGATTLVPCYADLVAAMSERGAEFHGALSQTLAKLLAEIFAGRRLAGAGLPVDVVIRGVTASTTIAAPNASLHLELDAALAAP